MLEIVGAIVDGDITDDPATVDWLLRQDSEIELVTRRQATERAKLQLDEAYKRMADGRTLLVIDRGSVFRPMLP